jgi:ADP-heptose:LPS heptosyltransferase
MIDEEGSYEVVFTFGPDETVLMQEIKSLSANRFCYYQSNEGIYQFCTFLSDISLFISTSTGTMHLAAAVNIPTFSFFGNHLIASSKRWAGLNETKLQYNFDFSADKRADYEQIKNRLKDFLDGK